MKIELKHLATYLPYSLKVQHESGLTMLMTCERKKGDFLSIESVIQRYGKPILRPLSDLEKEVTHNGEKFVPIDWFEENYFTLDLHEQCQRLVSDNRWVNGCDYMLIDQLIEWHFDVFGLIENGLAIDINTLKS